jgi:hypothetical protein
MRLLLHKQDEVAMLEDKLDQIDSQESCELFLGCIRRDRNSERAEVLKQLTISLAEYGKCDKGSSRPFPTNRVQICYWKVARG